MLTTNDDLGRYFASDQLKLTLLPTEQCNFRCSYCYEDFLRGSMSRETIDGVKRLTARRAPGLRLLDLSWFGGEPLLALDIVEEIQEYAHDLSRRHGFFLRGSMSTNAARLTRERFDRLTRMRLGHYQVTLDGAQETHDSLRRTKNGGGSFTRIWENLKALRGCSEEFLVTLRLHVTASNEPSMRELLELIAVELSCDERFRIFIRPLSRLGGPNDSDLDILGPERRRAAVAGLKDYAENLGLRLKLPSSGVCYASWLNAFVIRSDGALLKCTVALDRPANVIGHLRPDGSLEIDEELALSWSRGLLAGDEEAMRCPLSEHPASSWTASTTESLVSLGDSMQVL